MKTIKILTLLIISSMMYISCEDFDANLDPDFNEDPTPLEVLNEASANQLFNRWYTAVNAYDGPGLMTTTMADMNTCSWGNQGMRDMSSEPRIAWDNSKSYSYAIVTEAYFNNMYAILLDSRNLIEAIETGILDSDNLERTECLARFGQAASVGYLSLMFDRIWISGENGNEALTPDQAMAYALDKLDMAIQIANNNSFDIDSSIINGQFLSSGQFAQFLNSFAARLLVNNVRNSAQRDALDWDKVLTYANNGITNDFKVSGDGWNNWYNEWNFYSVFPGWARIDMRVINLMDPNTIDYWDDPNPVQPPATSNDARLYSDFEFLSSQDFIPSRGIYHYSNYRHSRYDIEYHWVGWTGDMTEMLVAENELYKAEAYLRLGFVPDAANVINGSSRVLRGSLPPVAANASDVAEAIHYERSIEILTTGMGLGYFEMRRENLLQEGTPLHFPAPGAQLLAGGFPIYTFGGTTGVAGEDYSNGGWR